MYMISFLTGLGAVALLCTGCSKEPGEGGRAEVRGRIIEQRYNNNTGQPVGQPYTVADHRVYIIYGDGQYHDDDVRTGPDGTFRFAWLRKGDYRIYAISDCGAFVGCTYGVFADASIGDRKEIVDIGDILIQNW